MSTITDGLANLEFHRMKAAKVQHSRVSWWPLSEFKFAVNAMWCDMTWTGLTADELEAKLIELGTRPKPETLLVELPTDYVEEYGKINGDSTLIAGCRAALDKMRKEME